MNYVCDFIHILTTSTPWAADQSSTCYWLLGTSCTASWWRERFAGRTRKGVESVPSGATSEEFGEEAKVNYVLLHSLLNNVDPVGGVSFRWVGGRSNWGVTILETKRCGSLCREAFGPGLAFGGAPENMLVDARFVMAILLHQLDLVPDMLT